MKIAIAQINPVIGDFSHNCSRIIRYSEKARALNCDLIVFSELVIPGYPPRDLLEKPDFIQSNLEALQYVMETVTGNRGDLRVCGKKSRGSGKSAL